MNVREVSQNITIQRYVIIKIPLRGRGTGKAKATCNATSIQLALGNYGLINSLLRVFRNETDTV